MKTSDTSIVGGESRFPSTVWDDLRKAGDPDAFNLLASAYWKPVYRYIRAVWRKPNEDAKDLTQEFFTVIFDPGFVARCDPERGSFRSFLITSLKNFLANQEKARKRIKRGGGAVVLSLDFRTDDGEELTLPISQGETPEEYFDRAWARSVLDQTLKVLEEKYATRGKQKAFEAFRLFCLDPDGGSSYGEISSQLGISRKDVDNHIYSARKDFRRAVADTVRQYISDPDLLEEELRCLFGGTP